MRRFAVEDMLGQFDHVLPYIDKGIGVSQVDGWLYAPLAVRSLDEPYTVYGLVAQRMERAERLLIATDSGIGEIATTCGFADGNYFAKAFRRARGTTPGEFRASTHRGEF